MLAMWDLKEGVAYLRSDQRAWRPRQVATVAGAVEVRAPRVDDRRVDDGSGQGPRFRSAILPPWCRRSPKVTEVLPLLHLLPCFDISACQRLITA